jgi:hypothetical protein
VSALEDRKLLMAWARLQLAIVIANAPPEIGRAVYPLLPGQPDYGSEDRITKTTGYKKLRNWYLAQSERARARARKWMRHWIDGCAAALKQAEASGDFSGLNGIEISYIDTSGQPLPTITIGQNEEHDDGSESNGDTPGARRAPGKEAADETAGGAPDHEDSGTV